MKSIGMTFKFVGYLMLVAIVAPVAWLFRTESFEGEVFADYDDDDPGEDVDPDEEP